MAPTKISNQEKASPKTPGIKKQAGLPTIQQLYEVGAHFGHLKSSSDARSKDFVFTYRNRIAIINLDETVSSLEKAMDFTIGAAKSGKQFLMVGTKLQARKLIGELGEELKIPYIIERWPGGLISNFKVVIKSVKRMKKVGKEIKEGKHAHLKKKERLKIEKDFAKSRKIFGGLGNLERKPEVVLIVDGKKEAIAVEECRKAGIKTVVICDTNSNPQKADYPIVANDDSTATLGLILDLLGRAIEKNYHLKPEVAEEVAGRLEGKLRHIGKSPARVARGTNA